MPPRLPRLLQTSGKIRRSTCRDFMLAGGKGLDLIPGGLFDAGDATMLAGGAGAGAVH